MNLKKIYYFHPILFGIFPVLSLFSFNISLVIINGLTELYILIFAAAIFALIIWSIFSLVLKNKIKASVLASFFLVMVFFFGHIQSQIGEQLVSEIQFFIIWISILAIGIYGIIRIKRDFSSISTILFFISITLILLPVIEITNYQIENFSTEQTSKEFLIETNVPAKFSDSMKPDIYYFIFDRYGSAQTLKEVYGYDNSEFLNSLEQKGFYVANDSFANYLKTPHSLASSLNMKYLNYLTEELGATPNRSPFNKLIDQCDVCKCLKSQAYKNILFSS